MAMTVKGSPMTAGQKATGELLLGIGKQLNAPLVALQAVIFAAIFESDLGVRLGWDASNPTYGGVLAGNKSSFSSLGGPGSVAVTTAEATSFFNGGQGYQDGGAIAAAGSFTDPGLLAVHVEAATVKGGYGPTGFGQYAEQGGLSLVNQVRAEAIAFVQKYGGGDVNGETLSTSGSSSTNITQAPFTVGDPTNPSEDFWTAINRLAQDRYWYVFSDGETLYLADGTTIMQQAPAISIDRWNDAERIVHLDITWDNTAFQFVSDHKKRKVVQRKSSLAKISSPVEAQLNVICAPDDVRGGDVVFLTGCGPGDGSWLVGTCRRSVFQIYSELTLVPATQPLTEGEAAGAQSNSAVTGTAASAPNAGTVISAIISAAATINNKFVSFVYWGGHSTAGIADVGKPGKGYNGSTRGYDSAGAVAAVLAAGGLWQSQVPDAKGIVSSLQQQGLVTPGQGSGTNELTLFLGNNIIFLRINGDYWGTYDTGGKPDKKPPGGTGGAWISSPPNLSSFKAYHFAASTLEGFLAGSGSSPTGTGGYQNPLAQANGVVGERVDMGVDYSMDNGSPILAIGNARVYTADPNGWAPYGAFIGYTLLDGQYAGKSIYVAESITLDVQQNSTVTAGQQIATFVSGGDGIETGWASGSGTQALAAQLGQQMLFGDPGGWASQAGRSFNTFLTALGCKSGTANSGGDGHAGAAMPPGYPELANL